MKIYLSSSTKVTAGIIAAILCFYACREHAIEENSNPMTSIDSYEASTSTSRAQFFNASVGKTVSKEIGDKWINNFSKTNGRKSPSYQIEANVAKNILQNPSCIGISLYYCRDNAERIFVLPVGVDSNGRLIRSDNVVTQAGSIDWLTAQLWIGNYTGSVKSHFFGANTFSRLLTEETTEVLLTVALDDNNNPQLLLSSANSQTQSFEDASWPCPPVCPQDKD